jgi:hypothetical protein
MTKLEAGCRRYWLFFVPAWGYVERKALGLALDCSGTRRSKQWQSDKLKAQFTMNRLPRCLCNRYTILEINVIDRNFLKTRIINYVAVALSRDVLWITNKQACPNNWDENHVPFFQWQILVTHLCTFRFWFVLRGDLNSPLDLYFFNVS